MPEDVVALREVRVRKSARRILVVRGQLNAKLLESKSGEGAGHSFHAIPNDLGTVDANAITGPAVAAESFGMTGHLQGARRAAERAICGLGPVV